MIKNKTPICDSIMKVIGWIKYEDTGLFYKRVPNVYNTRAKYCYYITFPIDHYGMYGIYEEWAKDSRYTIPRLISYLEGEFCSNNANSYCLKKDLKWCLPMLAADYYFHNGDKENHKKYVDIYETITNSKY